MPPGPLAARTFAEIESAALADPDAQPLTGYFTREALFRTDDGSFLLYMASEGKTGCQERILFLDCRDALVWLNATSDVRGTSWQFAESEIPIYLSEKVASLTSKEIRR